MASQTEQTSTSLGTASSSSSSPSMKVESMTYGVNPPEPTNLRKLPLKCGSRRTVRRDQKEVLRKPCLQLHPRFKRNRRASVLPLSSTSDQNPLFSKPRPWSNKRCRGEAQLWPSPCQSGPPAGMIEHGLSEPLSRPSQTIQTVDLYVD